MKLRHEDRLQRFRIHLPSEPDRSLFPNQRTTVICFCERCNGSGFVSRVLNRLRSMLTKRRTVSTNESRESGRRVLG